MKSEILPVNPVDKQQSIQHIRTEVIPQLIKQKHSSELVLQLLHAEATTAASTDTLEQEYLNLSYILFYAGIKPQLFIKDSMEEEIEKLLDNPDRYMPLGNYLRGNYRLLGCFSPNARIAEYAPEAEDHFVGAIPIVSKDYQNPQSSLYHPPILNINRIMAQIGWNFDRQFDEVDNKEQLAQITAEFYYQGLVLVHPFWGANHRAFDRFMEYVFAKKGYTLTLPQSETINIPNDDPFNVALYRERSRWLVEQNLHEQKFNMKGLRDMPKLLTYHHNLNEALRQLNHTGSGKIEDAADRLFSWAT